MAITSGFFNSKGGDRKYNAEQMSRYFDKLITSGVFPNPSTNLQVVAMSGMQVQVLPGRGMLDCHWVNSDSNHVLNLDAADVVLNRIDAVIMKLDLTEAARTITIEIKKGKGATEPVPPTMERTDYVKEYALAYISIGKLATEITQAQITDTRPDTKVCGWVTSLIKQVDTSTLFAQWQSAYEQFYDESNLIFDEWFKHLKETVATATLIKTFTKAYTTTTQDETKIPIKIYEYNSELDIFNVFINGMKLIRDFDFEQDGNEFITLTKPVDKGTQILFEVYKSVDGSDAVSIISDVIKMNEDIGQLKSYTPVIIKNHTIKINDWVLTGNYYEALIENDAISENDVVDVNVKLDSLTTANSIEMQAVTESITGAVKVYALAVPGEDIICDYVITKGVVA